MYSNDAGLRQNTNYSLLPACKLYFLEKLENKFS